MPTVNPVQSANVQAAIARAAQRTGVNFDYLLAQARLESNLDPNAKASTSSATGLYQFIDSTWLRTLDEHGAKYGMNWASDAIAPGGRTADPAARSQLLSLRYDADTSSLMAAELTRENAAGLRGSLGREPEPAELYLAHFLGLGNAQQFLGALQSNPDQSASAMLPQAARANRAIFYDGDRARTVGEVMALMRDKVSAAYGADAGASPVTDQDPTSFASASASFAAHSPSSQPAIAPQSQPAPQRQRSMADTLQSTFGDSGSIGGRAGTNIAAAYGKFRAFGL
ncbi:MAG: transglycosylase SLT domain-containing protein [Sphingomonadaceae bacterium]